MFTRFDLSRACTILMLASGFSVAVSAQEPVAQNITQPPLEFDYSSVFDDYMPFDQIPELGWVEANDNVGRIGGWRAYAKLVQDAAKKEKAENEAAQEDQQDGDEE